MSGYLGEEIIEIKDSPFADYDASDWALYFISRYGGIDGDFHKDWVLDQVARILNGASLKIKLASWENGTQEYRITVEEPPAKYHGWVAHIKEGEDGPETYGYSVGVAP